MSCLNLCSTWEASIPRRVCVCIHIYIYTYIYTLLPPLQRVEKSVCRCVHVCVCTHMYMFTYLASASAARVDSFFFSSMSSWHRTVSSSISFSFSSSISIISSSSSTTTTDKSMCACEWVCTDKYMCACVRVCVRLCFVLPQASPSSSLKTTTGRYICWHAREKYTYVCVFERDSVCVCVQFFPPEESASSFTSSSPNATGKYMCACAVVCVCVDVFPLVSSSPSSSRHPRAPRPLATIL